MRESQHIARHFDEALRFSVENLRSAANLVVFLEAIDYPQFRDLTAQNFASDTGLLMLEWQPVVAGSDREVFEQRARKRGLPEFRLWEPDESGAPVPAKPREEHVPVYFMRFRDTANDSLSTTGLDLAWSPLRMQSKWEARDSGRARGSEIFEVITGRATEYSPLGFAITLPVYESGYVPRNVATRREKLFGYMAGIYALKDVIKADLARAFAQGLIIDVHSAEHDHRAGTHRLVRGEGDASDFHSEVELDLYGSTLHLRGVATDGFVRGQFEPLWLVLPAAVLMFGFMTLLFLRRLESGQERLVNAQVELEALNLQLRDLSDHDALTGLYNRRATRNFDRVARWGGEEFAILLSHAHSSEALQFAERLRRQVADLCFHFAEQQAEARVTVSIGISTIDDTVSKVKWVGQADKALYLAKRSGRNCVRVFE